MERDARRALTILHPKVSVISAWHNRGERLEESIRSVLDQTGVDFEYIVIDDASTDGTSARLAAIGDPRLRVVRNAANIGFTRSMQRAVDLARGELIAVHDAGDTSLPGRLAAQAAFLDAHPDHVAAGVLVADIEPGTERRVVRQNPPVHAPDAARQQNPFTHGEVMFRKQAYAAAGGYREVFYYAQDMDLWLRLREQGPLGVVDQVLYQRNLFEGGIQGDPARMALQQVFSNLARHAAIERAAGRPDPVDRLAALAVLRQPPLPIFRARLAGSVKALLKRGEWSAAGDVLAAVPAGMIGTRLLLVALALRLAAGLSRPFRGGRA